jgi:hypothetical protein
MTVPRVGGVCDHRRCLERAHPEGCRMFASEAFQLQPGDVELVTRLRAEGWYTGSTRDLNAWRSHETGHDVRDLTPAQYRGLKRLEQGRAADERAEQTP